MTELSTAQNISFKIAFPFVNIATLVRIPSRIKMPGVIEFMERPDYELYTIQEAKRRQKTNLRLEAIRSNTRVNEYDLNKILDDTEIQKFKSYFLTSENRYLWHWHVC
jgi:hypothetical protein